MLKRIELARSGQLRKSREGALYLDKCDGQFQVPSRVLTWVLARDLLLFAVEAFDDAFAGYTNHSYQLGKITNQIFVRWENA